MRKPIAVTALVLAVGASSAYAQHAGSADRGGAGSAHAGGGSASAHAASIVGVHPGFVAMPHFSADGIRSHEPGRAPNGILLNHRREDRREGRSGRSYFGSYPIIVPYIASSWFAPGYADPETYLDPPAAAVSAPDYAGDAQNFEPPSPPIDEQPPSPAIDAFRPAYVRPQQPAPEPTPNAPLTLIFKDGRPSEQIRNYMLTRSTLYVQDDHLRRIPVDQIDLEATAKANFDAGVDFKLPTAVR